MELQFQLKLFLVVILSLAHVQASCIWYDECFDEDHKGNCLYEGEPIPLTNKTAKATLAAYCPSLISGDEDPDLCCSHNQITTLSYIMAAPKYFLSRCPSCYQNFVDLFCYTTCHPNASSFMAPLSVKPYVKSSILHSNRSVVDIAVVLSHDFADGMYNSCKDVQLPNSNQKAIDILCGIGSTGVCSPQIWLDYLGHASAFPVYYNISDTPVAWKKYDNTTVSLTPLNATSYLCSESPSPSKPICSCQDCAAVCPPHKNVVPPHV